MIQLETHLLDRVSGAAYVVAEYTNVVAPATHYHDSMSITLPADGSLPPEFQDRIDAGASWEEVGPFLIMYSIILDTHPELFK